MSTAQEVENAWNSAVFQSGDLDEFSNKFFPYDIVNQSEKVAASLYDATNKIQFFTYLVGRTSQKRVTKELRYNYVVEVTYYAESDPIGAGWTRARNALDKLEEVVRLRLNGTWKGTVDFWQPDTQLPEIIEVDVDDARCWRARTRYFAEKSVLI